MRKSYEVRGRNPLVVDDRFQGERLKILPFLSEENC